MEIQNFAGRTSFLWYCSVGFHTPQYKCICTCTSIPRWPRFTGHVQSCVHEKPSYPSFVEIFGPEFLFDRTTVDVVSDDKRIVWLRALKQQSALSNTRSGPAARNKRKSNSSLTVEMTLLIIAFLLFKHWWGPSNAYLRLSTRGIEVSVYLISKTQTDFRISKFKWIKIELF